MKKPRKLYWQLALSMWGAVLLLWALLMAVFTYQTSTQVTDDVNTAVNNAMVQLGQLWVNVEANPAVDEGDGMRLADLRTTASHISSYLAGNGIGGGMALRMWDKNGTEVLRSQLNYGFGQEEFDQTAQQWYLQFEDTLDDLGQADLSHWIARRRGLPTYVLDPAKNWERTPTRDYGVTARVGGIPLGGHELAVQRIELLYPDGGTETVMDTAYRGADAITLEFRYLELSTTLVAVGGPINFRGNLTHFREAQAILARNEAGVERSVLTNGGGLRSHTSNGEGGYAVAWDYNNMAATLYRMRWVYPITLLVALLVLAFLSSHLSDHLSAPLEELAHKAQTGGPCAENSPIVEVNSLATAFNTAQQKMADDLKREQDLTRAVAHELKTPLAILRAHAEALSEDIDPAKRSAYLSIIMDESERMAALVGELLDLSRMEAGAETLHRETVDLKALTERVFAPLQNLAPVVLDLEPITLSGDPKLLERAISNYASNALRHCVPGGEIRVTLRLEGDNALLTVENDGEAIPPEALPHLWDTFYKADTARTRTCGTPSTRPIPPAHAPAAPAWVSPSSAASQPSTAAPAGRRTEKKDRPSACLCLAIAPRLWYYRSQRQGENA